MASSTEATRELGGSSNDQLDGRRGGTPPNLSNMLEVQRRLNEYQASMGSQMQQLREMMVRVMRRFEEVSVGGGGGSRDISIPHEGSGGVDFTPSTAVPLHSSAAMLSSSVPLTQQASTGTPGTSGEHAGENVNTDGEGLSRDTMTQVGGGAPPRVSAVELEREQLLISLAARLVGASTMRELERFAEAAGSSGTDSVTDQSPSPLDLQAGNPFIAPTRSVSSMALPGTAEEVVFFSLPQETQFWKLKGFQEDPQRVFHELHVALHFRFESLRRSVERNADILRMLNVAKVPAVVLAAVQRTFELAKQRELRELQFFMRRYQVYMAHIHGKEVAVVHSLQRQRDELPIFTDRELAAKYAEYEESVVKTTIKMQQKKRAEQIVSHGAFAAAPSAASAASSEHSTAANTMGAKRSFWTKKAAGDGPKSGAKPTAGTGHGAAGGSAPSPSGGAGAGAGAASAAAGHA